jgi:hypothetical protein
MGAGRRAGLERDGNRSGLRICEVHGRAKHGAAYGYTKVFGYHPLLATRADTG